MEKKNKITLTESFDYAFRGLLYGLKTQRSLRIHFFVAIFVLLAGLWLDLSLVEFLILILTITIVLIAEMINTTLELVLDFITEEFNPIIKRIKNVCAAIVLIAAGASVIIGYLLLAKHFPVFFS